MSEKSSSILKYNELANGVCKPSGNTYLTERCYIHIAMLLIGYCKSYVLWVQLQSNNICQNEQVGPLFDDDFIVIT